MPCSSSELPREQKRVSHQEIELAAYYRYLWRKRNGIPGTAQEDFERAAATLAT